MYPISEAMKERFLSGQRQIARLTVNNNPYEPYKEELYFSHFTVEGTDITVYGGSVDVATGVLTVTRAYIGGSAWTQYNASNGFKAYRITDAPFAINNSATVMQAVSNGISVFGSFSSSNMTQNQIQLPTTSVHSCYMALDERVDASTIFLSYLMKEPVTYQLTPTEVKTFLGANNIWTDTGNVSVTYRNISGEAVTVSGARVTFSDGAKDVPVDSLVTDINYTQDLNGYDHPWVGGGGKNKFDINFLEATGITIEDGVASGTASALYTNFRGASGGIPIPIEWSGVYTLTFDAYTDGNQSTEQDGLTVVFRHTDNSSTYVRVPNSTASYTRFSVSSNPAKEVERIEITYYDKPNNIWHLKNIQLESGSSATDYAPYENICPIEGWESATIYQTGKNMFNGSCINGYYDDSGRFRQSSEQYVAYLFDRIELDNNLIVEGGKDYVISFDTIGIRGKDFYTLEFDKETGEYIRGTKTLRFTQQAGRTIPRHITVRPYNDSILVWYWDAGSGNHEYDEVEFEEITMVTLLSQMEEDVVIRETDIVEGSLSVNRYCTTGKSAMIGSCVASEMNVILNNENGKYNDVNFIGKDISVEVGTLDANDRPDFMPIGIFQVDDSPKKLEHISLTALDRMMLLEKPFEPVAIPTTIYWLYQDICERTNVRRKTKQLWNESYVIDTPPENVQTYRDVLSCLCEITGTCAYFDWDGRLCLEWFSQDEPSIVLTTANRIVSDLAEESVQITGVEVKAGEGTYLAGTDAYTLSVAQNPLVTRDEQDLADALYEHLGWLAYRPFTATTLPMPYIYPMDMATFVDRDGNESLVAITDWTFRLNRNTELRGRGESSQQASFKKKYGIGENGADIDQALGILRDTIIKNAEIINQQMETIERTLHGQYEALSSEFGSYRNETDAKITANAEGITQAYTNIEEIDSKYGVAITDTNEAIVQVADGAVATNTKFREVTEAYIKSGKLYYEGTTPVYGVAVGQLTYETIDGEQLIKRSGVYSVFTSEELAFYIDDVKVAYMKNKKLYINEAEFVSAINVGRYKLEDGANGFTIKYGG